MVEENEEMYYIRNEGFLGNALIWWAENSNGYTCDIRKAGKYKLEDATRICKRDVDSAYKCSYIDNLLISQKLIIDCQYVDSKERFFENLK